MKGWGSRINLMISKMSSSTLGPTTNGTIVFTICKLKSVKDQSTQKWIRYMWVLHARMYEEKHVHSACMVNAKHPHLHNILRSTGRGVWQRWNITNMHQFFSQMKTNIFKEAIKTQVFLNPSATFSYTFSNWNAPNFCVNIISNLRCIPLSSYSKMHHSTHFNMNT